MAYIRNVPAKRFSEPDTLHLMDYGQPIASAVWHRNTQSYRVRIGLEMRWAANLSDATNLLQAELDRLNDART